MAGRPNPDRDARWITRRQVLSFGAAGLSLPSLLTLRARAAAGAGASGRFGQAKSCIVLFAWGGMSHLDTWDLKPEADAGIRGEFFEHDLHQRRLAGPVGSEKAYDLSCIDMERDTFQSLYRSIRLA